MRSEISMHASTFRGLIMSRPEYEEDGAGGGGLSKNVTMKMPVTSMKREATVLERSMLVVCATLLVWGAWMLLLKGSVSYSTSSTSVISSQKNWNNLFVEADHNYTSTLTSTLRLNVSSSSCYADTTNDTRLEGIGEGRFITDAVHHLTLVAYDSNGKERCAGGDYYEVDLHDRDNVRYRSRLPTVDFGNGSYGLELMVPSAFAGAFSLEVWLLFGNWHGMDYDTGPWVRQTLMLAEELELFHSHSGQQELKPCAQADDFSRTTWQGRWTRRWFNDTCEADGDKRFRCLPFEHYMCEEPWCLGPLGRLESNGWSYSAHCSFKIFAQDEAWKCLSGRWFLMWGDSNFQDTVRNLLLFILDWWDLPEGQTLANFHLERTFETSFINPRHNDQQLRVSQIFNGANLYWENGEGLTTLTHQEHQQLLLAHFQDTAEWPDTIIMNSGLHDGEQFHSIEGYAAAVDFTIEWWMQLYDSIPQDRRPQLVWRATVAPAGTSRKMQSNPNKMEMYNQVMVEKLQQVRDRLPVKVVDAFDLTFPFHYNNDYSDGGHYGRAPGVDLYPWFGGPHWYFVDIMLAHILLNTVCPST